MADIIDMAQAREERERDNALRARELRARALSAEATLMLERGVCPDCGDAIEAERLRIIPDAVRCADCQGAWEQQQERPR